MFWRTVSNSVLKASWIPCADSGIQVMWHILFKSSLHCFMRYERGNSSFPQTIANSCMYAASQMQNLLQINLCTILSRSLRKTICPFLSFWSLSTAGLFSFRSHSILEEVVSNPPDAKSSLIPFGWTFITAAILVSYSL